MGRRWSREIQIQGSAYFIYFSFFLKLLNVIMDLSFMNIYTHLEKQNLSFC